MIGLNRLEGERDFHASRLVRLLRLGVWDSTDARCSKLLRSTGGGCYPRDSTDAFWDSADANPSYPEDSADESNSLRLIIFRIAYVSRVPLALADSSRSMTSHG
jgi:hypothetical protein